MDEPVDEHLTQLVPSVPLQHTSPLHDPLAQLLSFWHDPPGAADVADGAGAGAGVEGVGVVGVGVDVEGEEDDESATHA